jgi:hypothetical protein
VIDAQDSMAVPDYQIHLKATQKQIDPNASKDTLLKNSQDDNNLNFYSTFDEAAKVHDSLDG